MRIATIEEVTELFSSLYKPPQIEQRQGGQRIQINQIDMGTIAPISIARAAAIPARFSLHSLR